MKLIKINGITVQTPDMVATVAKGADLVRLQFQPAAAFPSPEARTITEDVHEKTHSGSVVTLYRDSFATWQHFISAKSKKELLWLPWGLRFCEATLRLKEWEEVNCWGNAKRSIADKSADALRGCVGMVLKQVNGTVVGNRHDMRHAAKECHSVKLHFLPAAHVSDEQRAGQKQQKLTNPLHRFYCDSTVILL
jgi:hypothetical protein